MNKYTKIWAIWLIITFIVAFIIDWNNSSKLEQKSLEPYTIQGMTQSLSEVNLQLYEAYSGIKHLESEKQRLQNDICSWLKASWLTCNFEEEIPQWALGHEPNIDQPAQEAPQEKYLGTFALTRYYRPLENQVAYHWWDYQNEIYVNCWGASCQHTADGYSLSASDVGKVFACPPDIALGTTLKIVYPYGYELIGTCRDRWGKIKNRRLDIWSGIGEEGYANIFLKDPTPTPAHWSVEVYLLW